MDFKLKVSSCLAFNSGVSFRAVGRSENPGVPVLFGGHNLSPLVEIGLTDLPKSGDVMAPPVPPETTGLSLFGCIGFNSDVSLFNCLGFNSGVS